jgi:hypothetical protein
MNRLSEFSWYNPQNHRRILVIPSLSRKLRIRAEGPGQEERELIARPVILSGGPSVNEIFLRERSNRPKVSSVHEGQTLSIEKDIVLGGSKNRQLSESF